MRSLPRRGRRWTFAVLMLGLVASSCKQIELSEQPRSENLEPSRFFRDGQSARTPPHGTIPRGELRLDEHLYEGLEGGEPAEGFPFELERADLERGRERYDVHCSPCHGYVGQGDGMIVQRGFPAPPSFHSPRLRQAAPGYIFRVITRGAAEMPSYGSRIEPSDRWRIAGYLQALQRSQHARRGDVPEGRWSALVEGAR